MQLKLRRALTLLVCLCPATSFAQSITVEPAAAVPIGGPWLVPALAIMLMGGAWWMLGRRGLEPRRNAAALGLMIVLGSGWVVHAIPGTTFTNPEGETLDFPVVVNMADEHAAGWDPADFTNDTDVTMLITAIDAPTFEECLPDGLEGTILEASPDPSPHPLCEVGDTLAPGATCRVSVDALCRAAAEGNLATLTSISPTAGTENGGTTVTLTGTNLTDTLIVMFGGMIAADLIVINDTTVTVTTPAHAIGTVNVVIVTSVGSATLENGFTYLGF